MSSYLIASCVALLVSLNSFGQLFLKLSAISQKAKYCYLALGYGLFIISLLIMQFLLNYVQFSAISIINSLNIIGVFIVSVLFLKEKLTKQKIFGSVLVVLGATLFAL